MATIYQNSTGQSVYDFNGQTFDAKTGQVLSGQQQLPTAQAYSAPVMASTKEPTVMTSGSAREATKESIDALNTYNTNLALKQQNQQLQQSQAQQGQTSQKAPEPLILIDPNTLQKINIGDPSINKDLVSQYLSRGFEVESGALPAGVFPGGSTGTQQPQSSSETALASANQELENLYKQFDDLSNLTPAQTAYIQTIKNQFAARKQQLEDINRREQASLGQFGLASGASRRSASFDSVVSEAERQGLDRLAELDAQELQLVAEAQQAFQADNLKMLTDKIALAEKIADQKQKELENIQKAAIEKNKEIRDQSNAQRQWLETQSKLKKEELDYMTGYAESIAPVALNSLTGNEDEDAQIIADMARQYEIDPNLLLGAVQTLADAPTKNVPGEFNLLQQFLGRKPTQEEYTQFIASLRPPKDTDGGGLTQYQSTVRADRVTADYRNEPLIKNFNTVRQGYEYARNVPDDTQSGPMQQGLIYAYAKVSDPDSAVREGEYDTIQKYSQALATTYGYNVKRALSGGPFLSPKAVADLKAAIASRYKAQENLKNQLTQDYDAKLNEVLSGAPPRLTNYENTPTDETPQTGQKTYTSKSGNTYVLPN